MRICIDISKKRKISYLIKNLDKIFLKNMKNIESFILSEKKSAEILLRKNERLRADLEISSDISEKFLYRIDKIEEYFEYLLILHDLIYEFLSCFKDDEIFILSLRFEEK